MSPKVLIQFQAQKKFRLYFKNDHKKEACLLLPKNRPLYEKVSIPSMHQTILGSIQPTFFHLHYHSIGKHCRTGCFRPAISFIHQQVLHAAFTLAIFRALHHKTMAIQNAP